MNTENKIIIKQAIILFADEAKELKGLRNGTPEFDKSVREFAKITGLTDTFIRLNIDLIRNWI